MIGSLNFNPARVNDHRRLEQVARGNTCRGVNQAIIQYLLTSGMAFEGAQLLDLPCGDGTLIEALQRFFPRAVIRGADLQPPRALASDKFQQVDASRPFRVFPEVRFDFLSSVSGVPEFDNTLQFFEQCHHHLHEKGRFLVTNDNLVTLRDRLSYFWFGKFRQYPVLVTQKQATWKVIPIHNLIRNLLDAGFEIEEIRYVSLRGKDLFLLPLAFLVYPLQVLGMTYHKGMKISAKSRRRVYPFRSLFHRHYMIICRKRGNGARLESNDAVGDGAGRSSTGHFSPAPVTPAGLSESRHHPPEP